MSGEVGRVLLVDDDESILDLVCTQLRAAGFQPHALSDGTRFFAALEAFQPHLAILDWELPDTTGPQLCRRLRAGPFRHLWVLLMTSHARPEEVVEGLDAGADDYLTKPVQPGVLLARVRALLRRGALRPESSFAAELSLHEPLGEVRVGERRIHLTPTEFRLLGALVHSRGRVLSRQQLLDAALANPDRGFERTIDVHIRSLRAKLGEHGKRVDTVRGLGYRFLGE